MSDEEALIKSPPRDELIVDIGRYFREKKEKADRARIESIAKEAERRLLEEKRANERKASRIRDRVSLVYYWAFKEMAEKRMNLEWDFLSALSLEKLLALEEILYQKAKRRLWWKMPLVALGRLVVPFYGWFKFFSVDLNKEEEFFPEYKMVALKKKYKELFGPLNKFKFHNYQ
mgnify:FL=1